MAASFDPVNATFLVVAATVQPTAFVVRGGRTQRVK